MKKILIILLFGACFVGARGNVAPPQAYISEILADSTGNWTIEMGFFAWTYSDIDSIRLFTSSGNSLIMYSNLIYAEEGVFDSIAIITNANLALPLSINPEGDFVKLVSYSYGDDQIDEIAFGIYPGSFLDCIHEGESVISIGGRFCTDSSPTIGFGNDTTGAMGNYSGFIFDPSGNPITGGHIVKEFENYYFMVLYPDENGYFNDRIFSRRYTFDTIEHHYPPYPYHTDLYAVQPVDFCLRPDSSHYQDIITTSLIIGVDEKEEPEANTVTIAPNPFSDKVDFYFNTKNPEEEMDFTIYSLDGKKILQIRLADNQQKYQWQPSAEIPSGTYIYRLESRKGIIKTGKFVRL